MKRILIDSDIFIDYLRGQEKARGFFEQVRNGAFQAFFSALTEAELISGRECAEKEKRQAVLDLLSLATKIPLNNAIAVKAGDIRRTSGTTMSDSIIAATAYQQKAVLFTRNLSDFKAIKEISATSPY